MPISSAWEVMRSTGQQRLARQPPAAERRSRPAPPGRASSSSSRTWCDGLVDVPQRLGDDEHPLAARAPDREHDCPEALPLAPSLTVTMLPLARERAPDGLRRRDRPAGQRLAVGDQDATVGRQHLRGGAAVREHRAAHVAEVLGALLRVSARDLRRAGSHLTLDVVLQVRPQLEHQERAQGRR